MSSNRLAAVAALLVAACAPENGPLMEPGHDCMECHGGRGGEEDAVAWTVAGTFGHQGSKVRIQDANGWTFTLTANQVGNFYTREPVRFPLSVAVDGQPMTTRISHGSCNAAGCHAGGDGGGGGG